MQISAVQTVAIGDNDAHVVEVHTASGQIGRSTCPGRASAWLEPLTREVLVGEDPRAASALWERLRAAARRHGEVPDAAVAALDIALWDLKARANDEPLWRTLGGARPWPHVYLSVPAASAGAELEALITTHLREHGVRQAKIAVSADLERDRRRLTSAADLMRPAVGEPVLLLDAEARWDAKQAAQYVARLERTLDLTWVADPRPEWDTLGLKRVSRRIRGAVCSGRRLGPDGFQTLLHSGAADVVEIHLGRTGITGALRIADAANGLELPVTLAAMPGNLHACVASVMANCVNLELADGNRLPAGFASGVHLQDGRAVIGDGPGLGLVREGES